MSRQRAASRSSHEKPGSVAALALLCSACTGSLFESDLPVPVGYVIASAPAGSLTGAPATQADLSIGRPDFAPGLDNERIAVLKGRQLDYYRGARWGGRTVEVVQTMLVGSLNDQKLFRSVTAEQARVAGDYMLDIEVRHFEADSSSGTIPDGACDVHRPFDSHRRSQAGRDGQQRIAGRSHRGTHDVRLPQRLNRPRRKSRWTWRDKPRSRSQRISRR